MGAKNAKLASYSDLATASPPSTPTAAATPTIGNGNGQVSTRKRRRRAGASSSSTSASASKHAKQAKRAAAKERRKRKAAAAAATPSTDSSSTPPARKRAAPSRFFFNRRKRKRTVLDDADATAPTSPTASATTREWVVDSPSGATANASRALDAALLRKCATAWPLQPRHRNSGAWNAFVHHPGVRELLDDGASVHAVDRRCCTPLHHASAVPCESERSAVVSELLAAGAEVGAVDDRGETPVHRAAQCGHVAVLRQLVEGASEGVVKAANKHGNTALHLAAEEGHMDAVRVLLGACSGAGAGAVVVANADGCTPMDIAKSDIRYELLQVDEFRRHRRAELAAVTLGEWSLVDVTDWLVLVRAENVEFVTPFVHNKVSGRVLVDSGASADALCLLGMARKPAEEVVAALKKLGVV